VRFGGIEHSLGYIAFDSSRNNHRGSAPLATKGGDDVRDGLWRRGDNAKVRREWQIVHRRIADEASDFRMTRIHEGDFTRISGSKQIAGNG
jgi:hypothetical protein